MTGWQSEQGCGVHRAIATPIASVGSVIKAHRLCKRIDFVDCSENARSSEENDEFQVNDCHISVLLPFVEVTSEFTPGFRAQSPDHSDAGTKSLCWTPRVWNAARSEGYVWTGWCVFGCLCQSMPALARACLVRVFRAGPAMAPRLRKLSRTWEHRKALLR
jgi:hypothetical protein